MAVVGRDGELAEVGAELHRQTAGAVVLVGEPGIGKTTVWQAACELARHTGLTVLTCRAWAAETQLSYSGLADLLEPVAGEAMAGLRSLQRRALEAALLMREQDEDAYDVRAVGVAVLNVLRELARTRPVLVAVDDLQWLDPASAAGLAFAFRRLRNESVLMVATARDTAGALPLEDCLPGRRVPIGPLSLGALHHIAAAQLGAPVPRRSLRRVHEISGGNPLYARELFHWLGAGYDLDTAGLPENLDSLVRSRLDALPSPTRRALFDVAALGEPTARFVDVDALEPALEARVVEFAGERIRFTHPLLAAGAYAGLSPPLRRRAHANLAQVGLTTEERARHLALATDGADEAVAEELVEAAASAMRRGAPAGAAELLEHALRVSQSAARAAERRLIAADAHLAAGDWSRARALLREVWEQGEQPLAAEAAVRLASWVLEEVGRSVALCESALAATRGDPALRSRLHSALCANLHLLGDYQHALDHAREALQEAEQALDRRALVVGLGYLGMCEVILAEGDPLVHLTRADELSDPSDSLLPVHPRTWLGLWHLYRHELDEAQELLMAEHDAAADAVDDAQRSAVLLHLGELEWRRGRWQAALRYAEDGYSLAEQVGDTQGCGALLYAKALIAGHLGRVEEARRATVDGLRLAAEVEDRLFPAMHALAAGLLESSLGHHEEALSRFTTLDATFGAQELEPAIVPYHGDAIEALVALGRLGDAAERLDSVQSRATKLGRVLVLADAARGRAALLAAEGQLGMAVETLDAGLELIAGIEAPLALARLLLARGTVLRRIKRRAAARADLEQAIQLLGQLGAAIWLERASSELARISGRRRGSGELTDTEQRIAELVASGQSNKEVASALFITVRTVESNLTRVYEKLGVRSRTELAHRLLRGH